MTTLRTYALREAERLAMTEALNAMIQLAEVRERALSESDEARTDLHSQVLAAERQADGLMDQLHEHKQTLERGQKTLDKQTDREERILSVLDKAMAMLPPNAYLEIQGYRNAALAEEIQF